MLVAGCKFTSQQRLCFTGSADALALTSIALERYFTVAKPFNLPSTNMTRVTYMIGG